MIKLNTGLGFLTQLLTFYPFILRQVPPVFNVAHCTDRCWNYLHKMLHHVSVLGSLQKMIHPFCKSLPSQFHYALFIHHQARATRTQGLVHKRVGVISYDVFPAHRLCCKHLSPSVNMRSVFLFQCHPDSAAAPSKHHFHLQLIKPCLRCPQPVIQKNLKTFLKRRRIYTHIRKEVHDVRGKHRYREKPIRHLPQTQLLSCSQSVQS